MKWSVNFLDCHLEVDDAGDDDGKRILRNRHLLNGKLTSTSVIFQIQNQIQGVLW